MAGDALPGRGERGIRWRSAVILLAILEALPGSPATAQSPRTSAAAPALPVECTSALRLANVSPVGLDDVGRFEDASIPSLSVLCVDYVPTDDTGQVTFDLGGLAPSSGYATQVVFRAKGGQTWARDAAIPGERLRFCFNLPGEDLAELYLILSNTSREPAVEVTGTYRVRPVAAPCGSYAVHARYSEYASGQMTMSIVIAGQISLSADPLDGVSENSATYTLIMGDQAAADTGPSVAGQVMKPMTFMGGIPMSSDTRDALPLNTATYVLTMDDQAAADTGRRVPQVGGFTTAVREDHGTAARNAARDRGCASTSHRRYSGRTKIDFLLHGLHDIEVRPDLGPVMFSFWEAINWRFGFLVASTYYAFYLLLTVVPLMQDLFRFRLTAGVERAFYRLGQAGCGEGRSTARSATTVVRLSDH